MPKIIRQAILKELKHRDWTIYRFAKELKSEVNMRVVYQYLSEGQDTGTEIASKMLEALGLTITCKTNIKQSKTKKEKT